jgi:hypothetical protein
MRRLKSYIYPVFILYFLAPAFDGNEKAVRTPDSLPDLY